MLAHKLNDDTALAILEPCHAAELYAIVEHNRAHLGSYLSWVERMQSVADLSRHIVHNVNRFAVEGSPYCGIWHQGVLVGAIDLMGIKGFNRCGEIGYWIAETYQGRGLVSIACAALIDHSFAALGINRMEIQADPANVRSRAIPERFGFTYEGNLRQIINMGDHFADRVVYAMQREDWRGSGQPLHFGHRLSPETEVRLFQPHDATALFALIEKNRAYLRPWMNWIDTTLSVEDSSAFIRASLRARMDGTEHQLALWYRGQLAGVIGTHSIDRQHCHVEVGYWLGEEFQGHGIATQGLAYLVGRLFTEDNINRIAMRIDATNIRSKAVAQRLNFAHEGTFRHAELTNGRVVDFDQYSLLRAEWPEPSSISVGTVNYNSIGIIS